MRNYKNCSSIVRNSIVLILTDCQKLKRKYRPIVLGHYGNVCIICWVLLIYRTILTEPQPDHNPLTLFLIFELLDTVQEIEWKRILYEAQTFIYSRRSCELPGNPSCCGSDFPSLCTCFGGCFIHPSLNADDYRKSNGDRRITMQFFKYHRFHLLTS